VGPLRQKAHDAQAMGFAQGLEKFHEIMFVAWMGHLDSVELIR
jgi:hypothetical protein